MIETAHYAMNYGPHTMMSSGWHWAHGGFSLLVGGLLIVVLVLAARALWRRGGSCHHWSHQRPGKDSALDILRQRYAQGEIDKEEFLARQSDLMATPGK